MTIRPIIFSGPMVRALLEGRKTQTRREAKIRSIDGKMVTIHPPEKLIELSAGEFSRGICHYESLGALSGPYNLHHSTGDLLWVREAWRCGYGNTRFQEDIGRVPRPSDFDPKTTAVEYLADQTNELNGRSFPSIFLPRWASRLTLAVTHIKIEALQKITGTDALAEGIVPVEGTAPRRIYLRLWNSLHGEGAWQQNPHIVALTFTVHKQNIDDFLRQREAA